MLVCYVFCIWLIRQYGNWLFFLIIIFQSKLVLSSYRTTFNLIWVKKNRLKSLQSEWDWYGLKVRWWLPIRCTAGSFSSYVKNPLNLQNDRKLVWTVAYIAQVFSFVDYGYWVRIISYLPARNVSERCARASVSHDRGRYGSRFLKSYHAKMNSKLNLYCVTTKHLDLKW